MKSKIVQNQFSRETDLLQEKKMNRKKVNQIKYKCNVLDDAKAEQNYYCTSVISETHKLQ